eukprot:3527791-Rhodomonas_salina.2
MGARGEQVGDANAGRRAKCEGRLMGGCWRLTLAVARAGTGRWRTTETRGAASRKRSSILGGGQCSACASATATPRTSSTNTTSMAQTWCTDRIVRDGCGFRFKLLASFARD